MHTRCRQHPGLILLGRDARGQAIAEPVLGGISDVIDVEKARHLDELLTILTYNTGPSNSVPRQRARLSDLLVGEWSYRAPQSRVAGLRRHGAIDVRRDGRPKSAQGSAQFRVLGERTA